jgi:hypothetical protein
MTKLLPMLALALLMAGCADVRPDTIVSPRLDSGITSSNGGGARALGNGGAGVDITTHVPPR